MDPVSSIVRRKKVSMEATTDIKQFTATSVDDRISNLHPELIGKILSLLPTKQAVATSVLSPRWKSFWTFISRLQCDDRSPDFHKPSFISFMYTFLYRKAKSLDYFSVGCRQTDNISHFRAWLSAVDVKELDLYITVLSVRDDVTHVLPFDLFSSKNLVKVVIAGSFKIDIPATVCLPNLNVLSLSTVSFPDNDSIKRLLLGCPAIEQLKVCCSQYLLTPLVLPQELFSCRNLAKLELSNRILMKVPAVVSLPSIQAIHLEYVLFPDDVSAKRLLCGCPSLQQLTIRMWHLKVLHVVAPVLSDLTVNLSVIDVCSKIVLETPLLRYLSIEDMPANSYELTGLNNLLEADLQYMRIDMQYEAVNNLIKGISNAKMLRLSGSALEVIIKSGCELPMFHNLTTLKIGVSDDVGWTFLPDLLEKSPFLEMLVFECGLEEYSSRRKGQDSSVNAAWHPPQKVPHCLLHHLKVIQINCFDGDVEDEEMIQYFIENGGVLTDLKTPYSCYSGNFLKHLFSRGLGRK